MHFGNGEHAPIQGKACAGRILLLWITAIVGYRTPVIHADQDGYGIDRMRAQTNTQGGERIRRAATRQVRRGQHRPTKHGVDEEQRVLANHEFLVEALLANLHIQSVLCEKLLLIPKLPETGGAIGLDAAGGLEGIKIPGA